MYNPRYSMAAFGQLPGITPTGVPGEFFIEGVGKRKFSEMREWCTHDQVITATTAGVFPVGTQMVFFRDIQGKTPRQTNMTQSGRLAQGYEMMVYRINVIPSPLLPARDALALLDEANAEFVLDEDKKVKAGPMYIFGSAHGPYGVYTIDGSPGAVHTGLISNGVPSPGANPGLKLPIYVSEGRTFRFNLDVFTAITFPEGSANIKVDVLLDNLLTRPLG